MQTSLYRTYVRGLAGIFISTILLALAPRPVSAQASSPVSIEGCYVWRWDNGYDKNYWIGGSVKFINDSGQTAKAVQFKYTLRDVFGATIGEIVDQREGTYSSGVSIEPGKQITGEPLTYWTQVSIWPTFHDAVCSVTKVLFADGTEWTASGQTSPERPPMAPRSPVVPRAPDSSCAALAENLAGDLDRSFLREGATAVFISDGTEANAICKSTDPQKLYVFSLLQTFRAYLLRSENRAYDTDLNLAIQVLGECISHYYATPYGATCETWQEKALRWKTVFP